MVPDNFQILYEEGPCLVVVKPGGLLTQAPPHIDSLESRIKQFLKVRESKPGRVYLGVPHRLDRPVSGVMVFAKHVRAARRIAEQFQGRMVEKTYWAIVEGNIEEDEGTWKDYTRKIPDVAKAEIVSRTDDDARLAILHYRVLARSDDPGSYTDMFPASLPQSTLLEIQLETGRMHQIRVQAASRSHTVIGDEQYGSTHAFGPQTDDPRQRWIALHARSIRFRHPMTRETVYQEAELPGHWKS